MEQHGVRACMQYIDPYTSIVRYSEYSSNKKSIVLLSANAWAWSLVQHIAQSKFH